jgi:hypothetical protein
MSTNTKKGTTKKLEETMTVKEAETVSVALEEKEKKQISALEVKANEAKLLLGEVALEEVRLQGRKNQVLQIFAGIEKDFQDAIRVMARAHDIDPDAKEQQWTYDYASYSFIKKAE